MKKIPLSKNDKTMVDNEDYEFLNQFNWYTFKHRDGTNKLYAVRQEIVDGKSKKIYMHRLLLNAQKGDTVTHINGNSLDNRRENLLLIPKKSSGKEEPKTIVGFFKKLFGKKETD